MIEAESEAVFDGETVRVVEADRETDNEEDELVVGLSLFVAVGVPEEDGEELIVFDDEAVTLTELEMDEVVVSEAELVLVVDRVPDLVKECEIDLDEVDERVMLDEADEVFVCVPVIVRDWEPVDDIVPVWLTVFDRVCDTL